MTKPLYVEGQEPVATPANFKTILELSLENQNMPGLVSAYRTVFAEPPWNESWTAQAIQEKIAREVTDDLSFLTLMLGPNEAEVHGFSWGAVIRADNLLARVTLALDKEPDDLKGLVTALNRRGVERLVYFDEFAISASARGGIEPVRFLFRPGLSLGRKENARGVLFWSTPQSKIVPLARLMGFEFIFETQMGKLPVGFLFTPDLEAMLKVTQSFSTKSVRRLLVAGPAY